MRILLVGIAAAFALASQAAHDQPRLPTAQIFKEEVQGAQGGWGVKPRIVFEGGAKGEVRAADEILVSTAMLDRATADMDEPLRTTYIRFVALHELWHVRQFREYGDAVASAAPELKLVFECQADVMANVALGTSLVSQIPPGELNQGLVEMGKLLRRLHASIARDVTTDAVKYAHLSAYQRMTALRLGGIRIAFDQLKPRSDQPAVAEMLNRAKRTVNWSEGQGDAAWSLDLCKKITRFGKEVMRFVEESSPKDEQVIEEGAPAVRNKFISTFTNKSERPIRIALTALSGSYPEGAENNYLLHEYFDGVSATLELAPGEKGSVRGEYLFRAAEGYVPFVRNWGDYPEMLIYAEYTGPMPLRKSCNDGFDRVIDPANRRTVAALMRIAGAARDGFADIPRMQLFELAGTRHFAITMPIPGARSGAIILNSSGGGFAYIEFYEGASLDEARKAYARLVGILAPACKAAGVALRSGGSEGEPHTDFPALTGFSSGSAYMLKREPDNENGVTAPVYSVQLRVERQSYQ